MTDLSLSLFGVFQAWTANAILQPLRTMKERALLAYLAVENGHPQRREQLAQMLWPDRSDSVSRNNLRQAIYGIRQAIGGSGFDSIFTTTQEEIQMNVGEAFWLDVTAFLVHIHAAQTHQHMQDEGCPFCMQHYRDAVELYTGDFLGDLFLENNPSFTNWVTQHRAQYFSLQMQSLAALVRGYTELGDLAQAALYARRQLELDPFQEEYSQVLMTLLAKMGKTRAAAEQYEGYQNRLAQLTGQRPSAALQALQAQIQAGEFARTDAVWMNHEAPHGVPEQLTHFVGREMEMNQVGQALANPSVRLISLVGPGGVGKTRLAIQVASSSAAVFLDGVFFIPLESLQSDASLCDIIGRALGLAPGAYQAMRDVLLEYLRERRMLLILDNFEHFLDEKTVLSDILKAAALVKIIVTSRERLLIQPEFLVSLTGLAFPSAQPEERGDWERIIQTDSMQLLMERACRVRPYRDGSSHPLLAGTSVPNNPLTWEDPREFAAAVRICQLMEGLPLGLELAASWTRDFSFAQIAEETEKNLEFLSSSYHDVPERQRSLRASFEHSWDLLADNEPEILCKLSVFPTSFGVDAALAVAGAALPWLMRLEDKSLVRRVSYGRYDLHPIIRYFAGQKLRLFSRKVEEQAHQQHAQYYFSFLAAREADLKGLRQTDGFEEIETELENVCAAWHWAVSHHMLSLIEQGAFSVFYFFESRSRWMEGERCFRTVVDKMQAETAFRRSAPYLLALRAWFLCRLTRFDEAEAVALEALRLLDEHSFPNAAIFAHFVTGFLYTWMGRYQEAWLHLSTSVSLGEQGADAWTLGWSREALTEIAFESGQMGLQSQPFQTMLTMFEKMGDQRGSSRALNYLGNIAMAQGDLPQAREYFEKMIARLEKLGDVWGLAGGYAKLGQVAVLQGAYEQAWQLQHQSLAMFQKTGDQRRIGYTLFAMAENAAHSGKEADAEAYIQQSLQIALQTRSIPLALEILTGIAARFAAQPATQAEAAALLRLVLSESEAEPHTIQRARHIIEHEIDGMVLPGGNHEGLPHLWSLVAKYAQVGVGMAV